MVSISSIPVAVGIRFFRSLLDIVSFEEGLNDGSPGRGSSYSVFFEGITQGFVFYQFPGGFHGPEQGRFRIWFGGLGPFLGQCRFVRPAFALDEIG